VGADVADGHPVPTGAESPSGMPPGQGGWIGKGRLEPVSLELPCRKRNSSSMLWVSSTFRRRLAHAGALIAGF
jgi:hypothetical protein